MLRVPIVSKDNQPLMPTKPSRARRWIKEGKAVGKFNDLVNSPKGIGYVSGQTEKQISVSDARWKRLGQIAFSKVTLIRRSTGLIVSC